MEKQAVYSMTEGSPAKLLLHFTIPMLIGNLFQQLRILEGIMEYE